MAEINLGGSVGVAGAPILGKVTVQITGNTDLTLTPDQYTNNFITVTSDGNSTGIRQVIVPLVQGDFLVKNATTEGYPITFIGPTGTGVSIPINITAICASDGVNFVLPNANSANVAPTNTGAVETSGQPVTNTETLGSHLQIQQDGVGTQIDGTYGDGTLAWNVGVWTFLQHSIIRTPGLDNTLPIMRIPLSTGTVNTWTKKPQWDKPSNRMYVPDDTGPRIYVIDTTPQVDPTGTYVAGCPGIVQTIDLSVTPVTTGFAMAVNIATGTIWCFNGTQAVALPLNGLTHQTFTLTEHVTDATYAAEAVWVSSYNTSTFNQYAHSLNPLGSLNIGTLICAPPSGPGAPAVLNQIQYDAVNNIVWATGNDSNAFGTITMLGFTPSYPDAVQVYLWSDPTAGDAPNMCIFYNGHVGLNTFILGGGIEYSQTGSNLGYFAILGGGPFNEPSPFFFCGVYDPVAPHQYIFSANNVSGVNLRSEPGGGSSIIWAYLGGLQEWVAGGGSTNVVYTGVNEATIIFATNEAATAQLLSFVGGFPALSGNAASITQGSPSYVVQITGLSGFAPSQNTEGGATITISGAADPLNNGTFPFHQNYPATNTGYYDNFSSPTLPDLNNGSINWSIRYQAVLDFPNTGAFGPKFFDFTQVTGLNLVDTLIFSTVDSGTIDLRPYLNTSLVLIVGWDGSDAVYVSPINVSASGGGGSPYGTFPEQGFPGEDTTVPGGDTTVYLDNGNQTYLNEGAAYSGSGPGTGLIAVSDGSNPVPTAINSGGSFSFQNRPYSRSDRVVTQISATESGSPMTALIYQGPPPNFDGGAGATLLMVMVTSVAGFEQPSAGSWIYMFDTSNNSGGNITLGSPLYVYNPNAQSAPTFSVDGSGNVSVTFPNGYYTWTIVVLSATMVVNGSL